MTRRPKRDILVGYRLDLVTRLGVGIPGNTLLGLMRAGTVLLKLRTSP